jgi:hypothetical protein
MWYGLFGLVGLLAKRVLLPVAILGFGLSLAWHIEHSGLVPFGRRSIEANGRLVRGRPGLIYFGALLGVGILTEMSTPLVWAGVVYSAAAGLPWAVMYGLGFGLGRSMPALAAVPVYGRDIDYGDVAALVAGSLRRPLRYVAVMTAAFGAATAAAMLLTSVGS